LPVLPSWQCAARKDPDKSSQAANARAAAARSVTGAAIVAAAVAGRLTSARSAAWSIAGIAMIDGMTDGTGSTRAPSPEGCGASCGIRASAVPAAIIVPARIVTAAPRSLRRKAPVGHK
jgi:hypothetical protein